MLEYKYISGAMASLLRVWNKCRSVNEYHVSAVTLRYHAWFAILPIHASIYALSICSTQSRKHASRKVHTTILNWPHASALIILVSTSSALFFALRVGVERGHQNAPVFFLQSLFIALLYYVICDDFAAQVMRTPFSSYHPRGHGCQLLFTRDISCHRTHISRMNARLLTVLWWCVYRTHITHIAYSSK
jgi:hypothetical protein